MESTDWLNTWMEVLDTGRPIPVPAEKKHVLEISLTWIVTFPEDALVTPSTKKLHPDLFLSTSEEILNRDQGY